MAAIRVEVIIDARPEAVWDAVRDWGALHRRLVPGFATDAHVEGRRRVVTFFTGAVLTERIVSVDDEERRLAWAIVDGPYLHHHATVVVGAEPDGRARFTWRADVLPDELAERTRELMTRGAAVAKQTLEAGSGKLRPCAPPT